MKGPTVHYLLVVFEGNEDNLAQVAALELRKDPRVLEVLSGNGGKEALSKINECLTCGAQNEQRLAALRAIRERDPTDLGCLTKEDFLAFCPGLTTPERADEIFEELIALAGPNGSQQLLVKGAGIQVRSFVLYVFQTNILPHGSYALLTEFARMLC
jgi:hypothetical protein